MNDDVIFEIEQKLQTYLDNQQLVVLHDVLIKCLDDRTEHKYDVPDESLIESFIAAKRVEGCSTRTLNYYRLIIQSTQSSLGKPLRRVNTEDLRTFLANYQQTHGVSKVTIDNTRRILSSFYGWLENENYILKSPVRRIHKVKVAKTVKEIYSEEALETLRDSSPTLRDLALIDLLASTGMRVGELIRLNRVDLNFQDKECIVFGKGDRERLIYFDARAKVHLLNYLQSRSDSNPALFVSLNEPHQRLQISGVECRLRNLGVKLNLNKVHPHKFRRTLATKAIDKGMPIEQVQKLLGHQKIDTTLEYAMVNQNNVKVSYRKCIG